MQSTSISQVFLYEKQRRQEKIWKQPKRSSRDLRRNLLKKKSYPKKRKSLNKEKNQNSKHLLALQVPDLQTQVKAHLETLQKTIQVLVQQIHRVEVHNLEALKVKRVRPERLSEFDDSQILVHSKASLEVFKRKND